MKKILVLLITLAGSALAQCPSLDECSEYGTHCESTRNGKFLTPGSERQAEGSPLHFRNVPANRVWWWLPKYPGEPYCSYAMARGGWRPYVFSATGLPKGMKIDSEHGLISGTVTAAPGVYDLTLTVTDAKKNVASARARLQICKPKLACDGFGNTR